MNGTDGNEGLSHLNNRWVWAGPGVGKTQLYAANPQLFFDYESDDAWMDIFESNKLNTPEADTKRAEQQINKLLADKAGYRVILTNWHNPEALGLKPQAQLGPCFEMDPETTAARLNNRHQQGHHTSVTVTREWADYRKRGCAKRGVSVRTLNPDENLAGVIKPYMASLATIPEES